MKIHNFGGIEFEETGEVRIQEAGEWGIWNSNARCFSTSRSIDPVKILRPVKITQGGTPWLMYSKPVSEEVAHDLS